MIQHGDVPFWYLKYRTVYLVITKCAIQALVSSSCQTVCRERGRLTYTFWSALCSCHFDSSIYSVVVQWIFRLKSLNIFMVIYIICLIHVLSVFFLF